MGKSNNWVATHFDADEIVSGSASVPVSSGFGGEGLGGTKNEIRYTSAGTSGTEKELLEENEKAKIGQIGGRRRRYRLSSRRYRLSSRRYRLSSRRYRLSSRRYRTRKAQKGGKRPPRLNVSIRARIRLSRRSRQ